MSFSDKFTTHLFAQPGDTITAGFKAATRPQENARTAPEPRTFTIVDGWDVTEAHGAPDAYTYGMCQSAASLARCMGSRVSYTTVGDTTWRMERVQNDDAPGGATWLAMDVTAVRQFDLTGS